MKLNSQSLSAKKVQITTSNYWTPLLERLEEASSERELDEAGKQFEEVSWMVAEENGAVVKTGPTNRNRGTRPCLLKDSTRRLMKQKRRAYERYMEAIENSQSSAQRELLRSRYQTLVKKVKTAVSEERKLAWQEKLRKVVSSFRSSRSREAWKWVKNFCGRSRGQVAATGPFREGNQWLHSPEDVLAGWTRHFEKLASDADGLSRNEEAWEDIKIQESHPPAASLNEPITWKEVADTVRSLKNNKAPGCDGLTAEWFKLILVAVSVAPSRGGDC